VFLEQATPAVHVRAWLLPYAQAYGVEFYPKQDVLAADGSGSLIRLPLGVHRRSRGWYPFVEMSPSGLLVPVAETVMACCRWLVQHVERVAVPDVAAYGLPCEQNALVQPVEIAVEAAHPARTNKRRQSRGHGAIREWCRSQDIISVIGRYVSLNRNGMASCPFKEHHHRGDVHPSFQVFGGDNPHWYCYTWGCAGDLFDFLCLYYGLSVQEGWQWLQQGRFE
jgi:hypothetical protein